MCDIHNQEICEALLRALDTLALAICSTEADGRLLSANAAGDTVFRRADGILARDGFVTARTHTDAAALRKSIAQAIPPNPRAASVLIRRTPCNNPYLITVTPLEGRGQVRRVMLVFRDPDADDVSLLIRVRELFGLTRAEAEVAVALGAGKTAAEIKQLRGVSANTMSAQLKSIMAKMDCNKQTEIAAAVSGLPRLRANRSDVTDQARFSI